MIFLAIVQLVNQSAERDRLFFVSITLTLVIRALILYHLKDCNGPFRWLLVVLDWSRPFIFIFSIKHVLGCDLVMEIFEKSKKKLKSQITTSIFTSLT